MKIDESVPSKTIEPLGKTLKDARLLASLSVSEVAEKLNLGVSTVRDLEDELDSVLETQKYPVIYLRGYLVNYARLVGINLTTLELFYEYQQLSLVRKKDKQLSSPTNLIIPLAKKRSKFLSFLFFLVILVAVIAGLFYFSNKIPLNILQSINANFETSDENVKNEGLTKKLIISENIASHNESESVAEAADIKIQKNTVKLKSLKSTQLNPKKDNNELDNQDEADNITDPIIQIESTTQKDIVVSDKVSKAVEQQAVASLEVTEFTEATEAIDVIETTESIEVIETTEADNDVEVVAQKVVAEKTVSVGPESLSLVFNADCWTEVFDATGERLAFGLYRNGHVLLLSGKAPFQLRLGDPGVVDIQYQDQIIEGEFTPGRSAQFSVPLS
jgi:cytoskeleton protein RodZ